MKIGVVQLSCKPGKVDANMEHAVGFATRAHEQGCDLVVFPEMVDTGYDPALIKESASAWSGNPYQKLCEMSKELGMHIVCGLSEKAEGRLFNAMAAFGPEGLLAGSYRKTHLITTEPACEEKTFTAGDRFSLIQVGELKLGFMICYDLRFPEIARSLALQGAHVILVSSAWPLARISHWKTLTTCRAIENQLYMACSNRVGQDGPFELGGHSCILDPWGETEGFASGREETLISADIDLGKLREVREFLPVFKQRREELYFKREPG